MTKPKPKATPVKVPRFDSTVRNQSAILNRALVMKCAVHKEQKNKDIDADWPNLGINFVQRWAALARKEMALSKDGTLTDEDISVLARDKPRSGRPRLFNTKAELTKIKKTISKKRGKSTRWAGQRLGCSKNTVRRYCKRLGIVPR